MAPRVWLITGTSSGFGRELTEIVLKRGDIAVATARRPETLSDFVASYPADRLLTLKLDVTVESDITAAFAAVQEKFGRLDVVVNNAGYCEAGEVESVEDADVRKLFETNFWGTANISREAVKFMREVNPTGAGGRIIEVASTTGVQNYPILSYYAASKAGMCSGSVEALLDADRAQYEQLLWPLQSASRWRSTRLGTSRSLPSYPDHSTRVISPRSCRSVLRTQRTTIPSCLGRGFAKNAMSIPLPGDPKKAMEVVYKLTELENPPVHFPLGQEAVEVFKGKAAAYAADADRFASEEWNTDLHKDA